MSERLNEDEPLTAFLGVEKFPGQSALGEWLRAIGELGWQSLRQINRDFLAWALPPVKAERLWQASRLESFFDDTQNLS